MSWGTLGVQRTYSGATGTMAYNILKDVATMVANPNARYVWRGHGSIDFTLQHSLHRRIGLAGRTVDAGEVLACERSLIREARTAGYDRVGYRELTDVELVALLQHEGAATRFLDVTPDPFVALFFACEHAVSRPTSAALVALNVPKGWPIRPSQTAPSSGDCLTQLHEQREAENKAISSAYLVETAFLNERMKAQRGQFIVGDLPDDAEMLDWASLDALDLLTAEEEKQRIDNLLNPTQGRPPAAGIRPPVVVMRIPQSVRLALHRILVERFGYTTQTVYPDLNGFALAFNQFAPI